MFPSISRSFSKGLTPAVLKTRRLGGWVLALDTDNQKSAFKHWKTAVHCEIISRDYHKYHKLWKMDGNDPIDSWCTYKKMGFQSYFSLPDGVPSWGRMNNSRDDQKTLFALRQRNLRLGYPAHSIVQHRVHQRLIKHPPFCKNWMKLAFQNHPQLQVYSWF